MRRLGPPYALAAWSLTVALFALAGAIPLGDQPVKFTDAADACLYAGLMLGIGALGVLIARREPRNPIAWMFCAMPLLVSMSVGLGVYAQWNDRARGGDALGMLAGWTSNWAWASGLVGYALFVPLLFPDGRLPGRRFRLLLWADVAVFAAVVLMLMTQPGGVSEHGPRNPIGLGVSASAAAIAVVAVAVCVLIVAGLASAVVRYRRAGQVQRLQIRGVVLAACASFAGFFLISVTSAHEFLYNVDYALLPIAMGLAMLRYRLYDVDLIIRRTVVYACLVGVLASIYLAGVSLVGGALRTLTGASGAVAVTLSTLAVVAAFHPLRARIQRVVERRFYRARYDAVGTLDAFSGRLREQVDLDALCEDLLGTVSNTVHPAHASLWLRAVTIPERAAE